MTIAASRNPATLAWTHYTAQATVIDPADGTAQDAYTSFNYSLQPNLPAEHRNGRSYMPSRMRLVITPVARVRTGAPQSADLLAHEQLHYDVGFVIGRRVAFELNRLEAANDAALAAALNALIRLHFHTRAGLIQSRYDRESNHSRNARYQQYWQTQMRACLANPNATQIGGWML